MTGSRELVLHVFTIGHSNHPIERFLELLKNHSVDVVADTRSYPYSRHAPQYDRESLKRTLARAGVMYVDLGNQLGGRPNGEQFYDPKGHVLYDRVAATPAFIEGLSRLEKGIRNHTVAILCSEENPAICHRKLLVARVLVERGLVVEHIRGDGRIQSDAEISESLAPPNRTRSLFADAEVPTWKSIPSVSRKKRQSNSSAS